MKTNSIIIILITCMATLFTSCQNQSKEDKMLVAYAKANDYPIKGNNVRNAEPAILFCYSNHLFEKGQKDDAVFWYYVAQYRYRILSSCSEHLKAGSIDEPTAKDILLKTGVFKTEENLSKLHLIGGAYRIDLYETIQKDLGGKINGYGYGDLKQMEATIDRMLAHEEKYPFNPMELYPKPIFKSNDIVTEKLAKVKESYVDQKKQMTDKADYIRAERTKNGLENR